ncbi:MAG: hypothetical protein M3388_13595 [Acidobacteriota bacterium]|nr:hypothetical protein [Acidobacteriota bacterium]
MPANERAIKGKKNKKTTDEVIPGKEKAKDRRESSLLPKQSDRNSNQDEPKADKQQRDANNNTDKGDKKPKKKKEEKKSKR